MAFDKMGAKTMQKKRITQSLSVLVVFSTLLMVEQADRAAAFVQTTLSPGLQQNGCSFGNNAITSISKHPEPSCFAGSMRSNTINRRQSTELYSFMGSDGGLFGIGTPELFTIVLIGYFVLGPSDLYKLVKEIGKFIQNFQTFATEATATLENNMESQLQLEEIRKAQRELNDAFSFRRSINVEEDSDPFAVNAQSPRAQDDPEYDLSTGATAGTAVAPKKKKMRRVKKKKKVAVESDIASDTSEQSLDATGNNVAFGTDDSDVQLANDVPSELDIDDELLQAENRAMESIMGGINEEPDAGEAESSNLASQIREQRMERLEGAQSTSLEESRFQQQLSGDWNKQILENNDKLEPLAEVMNLLAVLEEEKLAADKRLQEEFKAREVNEEKFYLEKRKVLEEAAAGIQAEAYAGNIASATPSTVNDSGNGE